MAFYRLHLRLDPQSRSNRPSDSRFWSTYTWLWDFANGHQYEIIRSKR